ncbi:PAS domain-containing protein [Desulfobacterales bacterium HSG17]|nr:PAS domain-containing protein [Desulfobacterales bacterium HSG17]
MSLSNHAIKTKPAIHGFNAELFNLMPICVAVLDSDLNIAYANAAFTKKFGEWQTRKCYQVYKNRDCVCDYCGVKKTFSDERARVGEEEGYDKDDNPIRYLQHTTPIRDQDGVISHILEICTDISRIDQLEDEYQFLFDQVPCSILLIDRDFKIIKSNQTLKNVFGPLVGKNCFRALKGLEDRCVECTAQQTFEDGQLHNGHHVWKAHGGRTMHTHVITVPLQKTDGTFDVVMEMAVDVTKTLNLEDGLKFANSFLETIISTSKDGIFAVNEKGRGTIFNPAARDLFEIKKDQNLTREELDLMLPKGFLAKVSSQHSHVYLPEVKVKTIAGEQFPVRLIGNQLLFNNNYMGMAFSIQDLREIKRLENDKLEAERLAAVGQTVAGLAHGVKNLITALEGGMYLLNSGLGKSDITRIQKGIHMLTRNIERISQFVKAFLGFSKGRTIQAAMNQPECIADEVVELYAVKAAELGIDLVSENSENIQPAPIDYESMHECLTNLVGNAIDACKFSDQGRSPQVVVRTIEEHGAIIYEVADNGCGMDYEVKQKVFTTFFTTKGLGGSGLGLLMTKKIVHEHGGRIDLNTSPGEGSVFRITLRKARLPKLSEEKNDGAII